MTSGLEKQVRQRSMNYGVIFGAIMGGIWFIFVFSSPTVVLLGALIGSILGVFVGRLNSMLMLHLYSELYLKQEDLRLREKITYSSAIFTFVVSFILFIPGTQYVFREIIATLTISLVLSAIASLFGVYGSNRVLVLFNESHILEDNDVSQTSDHPNHPRLNG